MDNSAISTDQLAKSIYAIKLGDENYDENLKKSEEFKVLGNELLSQNKFLDALNMFTKCIEMNIETSKNSIYYSNRAFVHSKMENYGLAVDDANKAIEVDNNYLKGHYRRASANLLLGQFDEAIVDLEFLYSKLPNETVLSEKIMKAKKERKKKKFIIAMQSDESQTSSQPKKSTIVKCLEDTKVETSYSGETYPENHQISAEWIKKVMEEMKDNKYIHKKYLIQMISKVKEIYEKKETLVDVDIPGSSEFSVCGDVHGQYYDLLNIFKINGFPSIENPYLFNGDFVDRGSFSVEIMITLLAWKILLPDHLHMARGNHETRNLNKIYGFQGEVKKKYDDDVYECFCELFCTLPLGHILNNKVLVVHGGLFSKDGIKLDEIKKIQRFREPPEQGTMCEILWSDPCKMNGRQPSKRGVGLCFGPDIAKKFLDENGLELLVRSHEVKDAGYEVEADGRVCTIFSAPNYCDQMGNKGALIRFKGDSMKLNNFVQFSSVPHPNVPPMKYANPWMFF